MNAYEQTLSELGAKWGLTLRPDANQSCRLDLNGTVMQIDLDTDADALLFGAVCGQLMAGPWRAQIFKQALVANGFMDKPGGILAFSRKNDSLILFQYLPFLPTEQIYEKLLSFVERAKIWQNALVKGEVPQFDEASYS